MNSVSDVGVSFAAPSIRVPPGTVRSDAFARVGFESRLPAWTQGACYRGDDLPGVPLDCFTSSMIDDGSDPSWVPYEHSGLDPVPQDAESLQGSDEELDAMEVDDE